MEQQYEFAFVQQYADDDVVVMDDQNESEVDMDDSDSEVSQVDMDQFAVDHMDHFDDSDSEVSQVDMDQFAVDHFDDSDSDMDEGNESGYETELWGDSD
jgi:hypothetical protein